MNITSGYLYRTCACLQINHHHSLPWLSRDNANTTWIRDRQATKALGLVWRGSGATLPATFADILNFSAFVRER
jgi:hypothetical protein